MIEKENEEYDILFRLANTVSVLAIILFIIGTFFPIFWTAWSPDRSEPAIITNLIFSIFIIIIPFIFFIFFRFMRKIFFIVFTLYQIIFFCASMFYFSMYLTYDIAWGIGGHIIYIGFLVLEISAFLWKKEKKQNPLRHTITH